MYTCIGNSWKLLKADKCIEFNQFELLLACFLTLSTVKRLVKRLTNRNGSDACIIKLSAFTLYWMPLVCNLFQARNIIVTQFTLIHHKSSFIGGLMSLFV